MFSRIQMLDLFNRQDLPNTRNHGMFGKKLPELPTLAATEENSIRPEDRRPRFKSFSNSGFDDGAHRVTVKRVCLFLQESMPNVRHLR